MRRFLSLILLLLLSNCAENPAIDSFKPSPKSKLVNEISNPIFKQLLLEKKLLPCDCGGRMMDQITLLHWGFDCYREVGLNEARELLVAAANQFLAAFNADERIRPYLATYPFGPENVEIRIFIYAANGSLITKPNALHVVACRSGRLDYMVRHPETDRLETILLETFEEAEAKLKISNSQAI